MQFWKEKIEMRPSMAAIQPKSMLKSDLAESKRVSHNSSLFPVPRLKVGNEKNNQSYVQEHLKRISEAWDGRAMVKKRDFEDSTLTFDDKADDFLEDLLPFRNHDAYCDASDKTKKTILTCGWLIYNEKTLCIESQVVTPACHDIMSGRIPGLTDRYAKEMAAETLVDESYHSLMVMRANNITREMRRISVDIPVSLFNLTRHMNHYQKGLDSEWKRDLTQMATAIVSEVFISDYLSKLSSDHRVQCMNRVMVQTHLKDEMTHGLVFKLFTKSLYPKLTNEQQIFFAQVLPKPVKWFADKDLDIWENVLNQIGFGDAKSMIAECRKKNDDGLSNIDYSDIIKLAGEVGITSSERGLRAFQQEGLIKEMPRGDQGVYCRAKL